MNRWLAIIAIVALGGCAVSEAKLEMGECFILVRQASVEVRLEDIVVPLAQTPSDFGMEYTSETCRIKLGQ